jgi:phosphoglycerate dehydrogenase-like enzyme
MEEERTKGKVLFVARIDAERRQAFVAQAPDDLEVVFFEDGAPMQDLTEPMRCADYLVTKNSGRIPESWIGEATRLKLVQTLGQGVDHLPLPLLAKRGIPVANAGGSNAVAVAEHAVLLMLASMRRLLPNVALILQGRQRDDSKIRYCHQLCGKTVGIVGFGNIGRWVCKIVCGFGANVIFADSVDVRASDLPEGVRQVTLEELLSKADIVTLHVPLTENTRNMVGWDELKMMKPTAFLINTSRGDIVEEGPLIRALREGAIAGAGLDVFHQEPLSPDSPLLSMENVLATPHIGGSAWENWIPRVHAAWDNIRRVSRGEIPQNLVNNRERASMGLKT